MTVEQALVYLLALVAAVFLFLGLAQALEGRHARPGRSRVRHVDAGEPRERERVAPSVRRGLAPGNGSADGAVASDRALLTVPPSQNGSVASRRGDGSVRHSHSEPPAHMDAPPAEAAALERPETAFAGPPETAAQSEQAPAASPSAPVPDPPETDLALVERAARLCLAGDVDELLRDVAPRLDADARAEHDLSAHATTALWCLVGLARSGEADARRAAFAASLGARASATADACPPRLAVVAIPVTRRLLDLLPREGDHPGEVLGVDDRMATARLAATWLSWHLHAAPDDSEALALLVGARDALADAHAEQVTAAIARQEYGVARTLVARAVEATELTELRGAVLQDLLGAEFRREIDRLTAAAIRGDHDDAPTVTGLWRAEALLGALPDGAIGPTHQAAVTQRIWRGHSKLGFRRLRMGQLDAAADTLFHALAMRDIGRRRQRQVRDALVRALEGLGDQRVADVVSLVAEGKYPAAADHIARLEGRIERARGEGLSDEELEVASAKLARLRRLAEATSAG